MPATCVFWTLTCTLAAARYWETASDTAGPLFRPLEGECVIDHLITRLLTRGFSFDRARARARSALKRVHAEHCLTRRAAELDGAEAARVAVARELTAQPKLIVFDEPTIGVDLLARDEIQLLLRSLADEGIAVLTSAGEAAEMSGATRALAIGDGELRGELEPRLAPVVPIVGVSGGLASA